MVWSLLATFDKPLDACSLMELEWREIGQVPFSPEHDVIVVAGRWPAPRVLRHHGIEIVAGDRESQRAPALERRLGTRRPSRRLKQDAVLVAGPS